MSKVANVSARQFAATRQGSGDHLVIFIHGWIGREHWRIYHRTFTPLRLICQVTEIQPIWPGMIGL